MTESSGGSGGSGGAEALQIPKWALDFDFVPRLDVGAPSGSKHCVQDACRVII